MVAKGCGGHLGRRAELPDIFLEENHPMTISSTFIFIEQMISDKKIFMGISHRVLIMMSFLTYITGFL
jgi:hypothetical protein